MKRIILSLVLLLIFVQNIFAYTDEWFDVQIANQTTKFKEQAWRCDKIAVNHHNNGDANTCLSAIRIGLNNGYVEKELTWLFYNAAVLYEHSEHNHIKAYNYWRKAASLGHINSQRNLDILCRKHSWVCK